MGMDPARYQLTSDKTGPLSQPKLVLRRRAKNKTAEKSRAQRNIIRLSDSRLATLSCRDTCPRSNRCLPLIGNVLVGHGFPVALPHHRLHHLPLLIGQPRIAAPLPGGQLLVIEAHQVENRRVQVVDVDPRLGSTARVKRSAASVRFSRWPPLQQH
jgi:hypothetical protein